MESIDDLVRHVEGSLRDAVAAGQEETRRGMQVSSAARQLTAETDQAAGSLASRLMVLQAQLSDLGTSLETQEHQARALGSAVAGLLHQAQGLLEDLAEQERTGAEIEAQILAHTERSDQAKHRVSILLGRQADAADRLSHDARSMDLHAAAITTGLDSMREAAAVTRSMLQELEARGYRTLTQRASETGISALLASGRHRMIALELQAREQAERLEEIALSLDLWDDDDSVAAELATRLEHLAAETVPSRDQRRARKAATDHRATDHPAAEPPNVEPTKET